MGRLRLQQGEGLSSRVCYCWSRPACPLLPTCSYSHMGIIHMAMNMLGLLSFAPALMDGRSTVVAVSVGRGRDCERQQR